jgi:nucleotide-binding universal stress UspA family protein
MAAFNALTVPLDASSEAQQGIDHACAIAGARTALHFCSVVDANAASYAGAMGAMVDPLPMIEAFEESAIRVCAAAVEAAERHGVTADGKVLFGTPAPAIRDFALETHSDGILMCTHARTGWARAIAGSVTESVLASSDVPVIITHAGDDIHTVGVITVAVDGSPASTAALDIAIALAQAGDRSLSILHVVESEAAWPQAAAMLSDAADRARSANLDFELVTLRGRAADSIVASALRRDSPMIVMGTRGRSGLKRAVLGSVAAEVVERAKMPVTVVRRP